MSVRDDIRALADKYARALKEKIDERVEDMDADDKSHFLIYQVLGLSDEEGHLIDVYQNKGRFLYRYAGAFLENAAKLCFKSAHPDSGALRIKNTQSGRPKTFEIDCLVGSDALEIKWRDATTDGDHITKEHTRIQAIAAAGYIAIRVMFYYPNRDQAVKIQKTLETLYAGVGGKYYFGDAAWAYVHERTGVDLKAILEELAAEEVASMHTEVRHGDCLEIARELPSGSARLIYLDPPFLTQKTHSLRTRDRATVFSFDDFWASHEDYARFLDPRLREFHRIVADDGSIFFHCDRRASHIARALLDRIFGQDNFRSEVIWHYRRWSNSQRTLLPAHQTLYFYSKSEKYIFNPTYGEYSPSTNVDQILQRRKRDRHGKATYDRDESGAVVTAGPKKGVPLCDVWDIPFLNPKAKERTGYPTQKPVLLLERIIKLVTGPGDLVVDPFCGSGTTLVALGI